MSFTPQIRLDQNTSFLKTSRHYQAVVDIDVIVEKPDRRKYIITCAALYCILAPHDNEQQDMMLKLSKSKMLDETPVYCDLLRLFLSKELINFQALLDQYGKELLGFEVFSQETAHGKKCWSELNTRAVEHVSVAATAASLSIDR